MKIVMKIISLRTQNLINFKKLRNWLLVLGPGHTSHFGRAESNNCIRRDQNTTFDLLSTAVVPLTVLNQLHQNNFLPYRNRFDLECYLSCKKF